MKEQNMTVTNFVNEEIETDLLYEMSAAMRDSDKRQSYIALRDHLAMYKSAVQGYCYHIAKLVCGDNWQLTKAYSKALCKIELYDHINSKETIKAQLKEAKEVIDNYGWDAVDVEKWHQKSQEAIKIAMQRKYGNIQKSQNDLETERSETMTYYERVGGPTSTYA